MDFQIILTASNQTLGQTLTLLDANSIPYDLQVVGQPQPQQRMTKANPVKPRRYRAKAGQGLTSLVEKFCSAQPRRWSEIADFARANRYPPANVSGSISTLMRSHRLYRHAPAVYSTMPPAAQTPAMQPQPAPSVGQSTPDLWPIVRGPAAYQSAPPAQQPNFGVR